MVQAVQLDELQAIPCEDYGFPIGYFYIQTLWVMGVDYRVLFMPLSVDPSDIRWRLEPELGALCGDIFEVKFVLGDEFERVEGYHFSTPQQIGLSPSTPKALTALGDGLVQVLLAFSESVAVEGLVAIALDDKPTLKRYYRRILERHKATFQRAGFTATSCLGDQGYALFKTVC